MTGINKEFLYLQLNLTELLTWTELLKSIFFCNQIQVSLNIKIESNPSTLIVLFSELHSPKIETYSNDDNHADIIKFVYFYGKWIQNCKKLTTFKNILN